jgi:AcrR family transcriptional regulator
VHRHFPTKEALLAEVVAARLSDLLDRAISFSADRDPGEAFFAFWTHATELAHRNAAICEAFTAGSGEELLVPDELRERFLAVLADMLAAAKATGAVRHDIDVLDVIALLSASVLAEHRRGSDTQPGRLAAIVAGALGPPASHHAQGASGSPNTSRA